jgi:hypothetical protein
MKKAVYGYVFILMDCEKKGAKKTNNQEESSLMVTCSYYGLPETKITKKTTNQIGRKYNEETF